MKRISLRLPDELHERLVDAAKWNDRSLNAEIVHKLDSTPDVTFRVSGNPPPMVVPPLGYVSTATGGIASVKTDFKRTK